MEDCWEDDGLDDALVSACALAEVAEDTPPLIIAVSDSESDYYDWQRKWETQNLHNGLFSEHSDPGNVASPGRMDSTSEQGQQPSIEQVCEPGQSGIGCTQIQVREEPYQQPLEFSSELRARTSEKELFANRSTSDVHHGAAPKNKRRALGELFESNKRVRGENCEAQVAEKKKSVGGIAPNHILSAGPALHVRWRNGIFHGRTFGDLYNHCNGIISSTNRFIHDILPDSDGRGIAQFLEQLSTTRKSNGLWMVAIHRSNGASHNLVLPGTLPSRTEAIEVGKLINAEYGSGADRHAHIVHVCPWASNYCRCRPLQGLNIKRRTRPIRPWRTISDKHFINLILYLLRHPRQLCIFEVGGSPVDISLDSSENLGGNAEPDMQWDPVWPSSQQVNCADWKLVKPDSAGNGDPGHDVTDDEGGPAHVRRRPQDLTVDSIATFLQQICVSPPKSSCRTLEWVNGPVASYSAVDSEYNLAVRKWKTQLCYWSFEDFCHHYDYIQPNPVFVPMTTYLSVTESLEMVERILEIQTDGKIGQFVKEVYAVMEKTLPKKNCIYVISAPSSGKNYVFDAIRTFYLNTGQMGNFNRNTSFPFQDCDSRRVILWNEPNIEPCGYILYTH